MSVDPEFAIALGREAAEQLMLDAVRVDRPTGAVDPITGQAETEQVYPDPAWPDGHRWARGNAKVQNPGQPYGNTADVGGGTVDTQSMFIHLPVGAYEPRVGDVFTVTAATRNPYLLGRRYVLRDLHHVSLSTAYRLRVEDLDRFGRTDG